MHGRLRDVSEWGHLIQDVLAGFDNGGCGRQIREDIICRYFRCGEGWILRPVPRSSHAVEWPQYSTHRRIKLSGDSRVRRDLTAAADGLEALILQDRGQRNSSGIIEALVSALRVTITQQLGARQVLARLHE